MSTLTHRLQHIFLERIMTDALEYHDGTVSFGAELPPTCVADDIDGLAGEEEELANLVERLDKRTSTA